MRHFFRTPGRNDACVSVAAWSSPNTFALQYGTSEDRSFRRGTVTSIMGGEEVSLLLPRSSPSNSSNSSSGHGKASLKASAPAAGEPGSAVSAFLGLATTMMGACILSLPSAVQAVGVVPALLLFLFGAWIAYHSFEMLCVSADVAGAFSYEALSSRLFGAAGVWAVRVLTLALLFGAIVMYMVIAMDLFEPFVGGYLSRHAIGGLFAVIAVPLCLPETIHELRYTNLMVIVCLVYILVVLAVRCALDDPEFDASIHEIPANEFHSELAAIAYAAPITTLSYACQLNVPRAYQEIHDKEAIKHVHRALVAFAFVCYVAFALLGYYCFKGQPPSDILTGFAADDTLINTARLALGVTMLLKTPMTFQPLRQLVELCCLGHDRESLPFRAAITIVFMALVYLCATSSSNLGVIMAFVGAIAGNMLTATVPGMFLYEVATEFYGEEIVVAGSRATFYSRRLALIFAYTGVAFSVMSLTYLSYNALAD